MSKRWKKLFEKKLDERQQADLYKLEHYGFWIVFYLLLLSLIWQAMFQERPFGEWWAEWAVFMLMAIYEVAGCIKIGVWSSQTDMPSRKGNILWALGASAFFSILAVAARYFQLEKQQRNPIALAGIFVWNFIPLFILVLSAYTLTEFIFKRRKEKLEKRLNEECEEDGEEI